MTDKTPPAKYRVRTLDRISRIDAASWNICAGVDNPFLSHGVFNALEESGSLCTKTGFQAKHLLVEDANANLLGVAPQYLRQHAYAGHGPDAQWVDLFRQRGLKYFPKLQVEVPYMPNVGERLLVAAGQDRNLVKKVLINGLKRIARQSGVDSLQVGFVDDEDRDHLIAAGFTTSAAVVNIWRNRNYVDFENFLSALRQRRRNDIRRERRKVRADGVRIERVFGSSITADLWRIFYQFHLNTNRQYGTKTYLNEVFFQRLGATLQDRLYLALAMADGKPVAGTLHIIGKDFMFPRYWGCLENARFLHFECTYYNSIEYAIEHGLDRIEAGTGGDHKRSRGFLPEIANSAHLFQKREIHTFIDQELAQSRAAAAAEVAKSIAHSPFISDQ